MNITERDWFTWLAQTLTGESADIAPAEVQAAIAAAEGHGVTGLLWEALACSDGTGAVIRKTLDAGVRAAATREAIVQRELTGVLGRLHERGVQSLTIKGSALAYSVYTHPWLRPRTDTDILVRAESVAPASAALEECGYVRSDALNTGALVSHQIAFERIDSHGLHHVIDLHWKIVNPQLLADALRFDDLCASAVAVPALGAGGHVPADPESILLACIHRLAHHQGHNRLIWLYDLKLLTERMNADAWTTLGQQATVRGVAAICLDGLQQARRRLNSCLPSSVERALAEAAPSEASRSYVLGTVHKRDVLLSDLRELPTWADRLRLILEHLFPPAAFIQQRYATRHGWLLPLCYAHRLITGAYKWVRA